MYLQYNIRIPGKKLAMGRFWDRYRPKIFNAPYLHATITSEGSQSVSVLGKKIVACMKDKI